MASSSLSQESLDHDDDSFNDNSADFYARRSRIRAMRAKGTLYKTDRELPNSIVPEVESGQQDVSPNRLSACRVKEKRTRPNHMHGKGKLAKDKRKLREKRRSTGVVCLPSTESTGDSLDDDGPDAIKVKDIAEVVEPVATSAVKPLISMNINYNSSSSNCTTSKSPSDVDADLEDNQEECRIHSDSTPVPDLVTKLPKQKSIDSSINGYREAITRSGMATRNNNARSSPSNVQSLAANFTNRYTKTDRDSKLSSIYTPNGYTPVRRAVESPLFTERNYLASGRQNVMLNQNKNNNSSLSPSTCQVNGNVDRPSKLSSLTDDQTLKFRPVNYGSPMATKMESLITKQSSTESVSQKDDIEKLKSENEKLCKLLKEKDAKIAQLEEKVAGLQKTVEQLELENSTVLKYCGTLHA